jgi:hypothetical protein
MKSPRFCEPDLHQRKNTLAWLVALAVLIVAPCRAQSTGAVDSAVAAPPDSVRPDSVRPDSVRPDSVRPDSARTDSAAVAPGDSLARPRADSTTPPGRLVPAPSPVDSVLGAACEETGPGPADVWLVMFLPTTTERERSAAAQQVGGTLLGMSQNPGSWYLRVPGRAGDPTVADRLILLPPVLEVGSTRCPS